MNWLNEMFVVRREAQYAIDNLKAWMKPEHVDMPIMLGPASASTLYEPLGTICLLGSWNFPLFTTVMPMV